MTGFGSDRPWEMAPGTLGSHPFLSKHLCRGCPTPIPSSPASSSQASLFFLFYFFLISIGV